MFIDIKEIFDERKKIENIFCENNKYISIDFKGVEDISYRDFDKLLKIQKIAALSGKRLKFNNVENKISEMFSDIGFLKIFKIDKKDCKLKTFQKRLC